MACHVMPVVRSVMITMTWPVSTNGPGLPIAQFSSSCPFALHSIFTFEFKGSWVKKGSLQKNILELGPAGLLPSSDLVTQSKKARWVVDHVIFEGPSYELADQVDQKKIEGFTLFNKHGRVPTPYKPCYVECTWTEHMATVEKCTEQSRAVMASMPV